MKKTILCILYCVLVILAKAQQPDFKWAKQYTGTDTRSVSIIQNTQGDLITVGSFYDTTNYGIGNTLNTITSNGSSDIFIRKLDAFSNHLWSKHIGGIGFDDASAMCLDASNNIYIAGRFSGSVDFDPGAGLSILTSSGNYAPFILKLDQNGNFIWVKSFSNLCEFYTIKIDLAGNLLTAGYFSSTLDFDPSNTIFNLSSNGYTDAFILKLNNNGNFVWAKNMGGMYDDNANDLVIDSVGSIYTVGQFQGTADFDPNAGVYNLVSSAATTLNVFINKLDSLGNFVWAKSFFSQSYGIPSSIAIDHNGSILTTGYFLGTTDFDPGIGIYNMTSNGGTDCFISKLSNNGSFVWAKSIGSTQNDYGTKICINSQNDIYLSGEFDDTVDFDPSSLNFYLTSLGNLDAFILKLNSTGSFYWVEKFSGLMSEIILYMDINDNGDIFTTGIFQSTTDFDPSASSNSLTATVNNTNTNGFVNKLGFCQATTDTIYQDTCNLYVLNGQTYTQSGQYIQNFQNSAGCDSFLVLNLMLNNTTDTISITNCDSILINNQTYYNSGTYSQLFLNSAGCDSLLIIQANVNHSSSNSLSVTACNSYTLNNQTYYSSGTYQQIINTSLGCDSLITLNLNVLQNATTYHTINLLACNSYIFNNQTLTSSGTYTDTLLNSIGCDSIITLNLTINNVNTTITQNGTQLTAIATGAAYQWLTCNPFTIITGAINQTFTATTNGNYAVIVFQNDCTDTSNCITVNSVGINEVNSQNLLTISPNPTSSIFEIKGASNGAIVTLYNTFGQKLIISKIENQTPVIDISAFAKGIYFVEVKQSNTTSRVKISKE